VLSIEVQSHVISERSIYLRVLCMRDYLDVYLRIISFDNERVNDSNYL